ncbi:MAG: glutamate--tRNA ligase [Bdellovibrio sp.]|nr:glutamate--tRNA ligase [Bdellovibrio sp.]
MSTVQVRVRFAPSPTGFLHIGGVRTALFNWLYAKHENGKFLLRIEDTDLERSEENFTRDIFRSLEWLGLAWDEEIIFQSKRLKFYQEKAQSLVEHGFAYYCDCSESDVEQMRERAKASGKKPQYDRHCRDLNKSPDQGGHATVLRAKLPLQGSVEFRDLIRGHIKFENQDLDDFVLIRSNGAPTYNLSCVVDDVESKITHVIRGDDHINNTPKQIHLYEFFRYQVPKFAHLPMILGQDKKKLSKRHGAVSVNWYHSEGFLPEALLNFLVRLGWSHGDQEVFSTKEMVDFFSFDKVQKSSGVFNGEKLLWLNGDHLRRTSPQRLCKIIFDDFSDYFRAPAKLDCLQTVIAEKLVTLMQPKVKQVKEIAEQMVPLCTPDAVEVDATLLDWSENLKKVIQVAVKDLREQLALKIVSAKNFTRVAKEAVWGNTPSLLEAECDHGMVDQVFRQICENHGVKLSELAKPVRLCVTGRLVSAGLFDLVALLPWDVVEARLKKVEQL